MNGRNFVGMNFEFAHSRKIYFAVLLIGGRSLTMSLRLLLFRIYFLICKVTEVIKDLLVVTSV
mgnify:CR=1 FL=1